MSLSDIRSHFEIFHFSLRSLESRNFMTFRQLERGSRPKALCQQKNPRHKTLGFSVGTV